MINSIHGNTKLSAPKIFKERSAAIGGIAGSLLPFNSEGIDFAMTALFVVIFVEQWMEKKNRIPELIGVLAALLTLNIFGAENFVLPCMLLIICILFVSKKKLERSGHGKVDAF